MPHFERNTTTVFGIFFILCTKSIGFSFNFPQCFCNVDAYFECALKENEYAMQP